MPDKKLISNLGCCATFDQVIQQTIAWNVTTVVVLVAAVVDQLFLFIWFEVNSYRLRAVMNRMTFAFHLHRTEMWSSKNEKKRNPNRNQ